jgi:hypothetical protein
MEIKVKILKVTCTLLSVHMYVFLRMSAEVCGLISLQAVVCCFLDCDEGISTGGCNADFEDKHLKSHFICVMCNDGSADVC